MINRAAHLDLALSAEEARREAAVELALKLFPSGAGGPANVIAAAKEIEKYLKGETPSA